LGCIAEELLEEEDDELLEEEEELTIGGTITAGMGGAGL
jgi:hypothetical protein